MIIADLIDSETRKVRGRVYLSETPIPGDVVATRDNELVLVIRRQFLDLGPEGGPERLSAQLIVRTA